MTVIKKPLASVTVLARKVKKLPLDQRKALQVVREFFQGFDR